MVNLRWALTAGIIALVISIGLGIISGVNAFHIFIRALVFFVVFFGLGFCFKFIVDNYFPEFLYTDSGEKQFESEQPGSRVNITLDTAGEYAVPELYKIPGDPNELGNIEDLISGYYKPHSEEGVDRKEEAGYNDRSNSKNVPFHENIDFSEEAVFEKPKAAKPVFTPSFGDDSGGLGGLPDLDALAMSFSHMGDSRPAAQNVQDFEPDPMDIPIYSSDVGSSSFDDELEPVQSRYVGNKPQQLDGDFNPKELAEGIRTVLSKDKG